VQRYLITIEGSGFKDVQEIELPRPPGPGEPIETQLGTCLVTRVEPFPEESRFDGRIVCSLP
jgi:hypothetical protein